MCRVSVGISHWRHKMVDDAKFWIIRCWQLKRHLPSCGVNVTSELLLSSSQDLYSMTFDPASVKWILFFTKSVVFLSAGQEKVVPPPIWDCLSIFTEMLNSCVNVVIYASFGKQFRKTFFELFCSPCQKGNQVGPGQVLELKENSSSKTNSATNNTGITSA